ncbi:hypothetical protein STENM223S_00656 [Streptomyces tendae]
MAFSMTISWSGEPVTKAAMPSRATDAAAVTGVRIRRGNRARTTTREARPPKRVPRREWSARRPPSRLPAVAPTPNRASSSVTLASANPAASVSIGVM